MSDYFAVKNGRREILLSRGASNTLRISFGDTGEEPDAAISLTLGPLVVLIRELNKARNDLSRDEPRGPQSKERGEDRTCGTTTIQPPAARVEPVRPAGVPRGKTSP